MANRPNIDSKGLVIAHGAKQVAGWFRHHSDWFGCTKCAIGGRASTTVLARGHLPCDVLFVGEAPGKTEDAVGYPFVGPAGDLLAAWIAAADAGRRPGRPFKYAVTNTVACRPCDKTGGPNRPPTDLEQANCSPRFGQLLSLAAPSVIVLVGKVASLYWYGLSKEMRGSRPVLEIYHPAYCLRSGGIDSRPSKETQDLLRTFLTQHQHLFRRSTSSGTT